MHQVLNEKIPYFSDDGLSCAESTLRYLIEHGYADLPLDTVRIMTGLHGNMGRCANCGAVNGSVAAIGANFGRREVGEDMTLLYELTERFMREFEQTFGSVKCAELMEGKDPALMEQQHKCADIVAGAVDIAARIKQAAGRVKNKSHGGLRRCLTDRRGILYTRTSGIKRKPRAGAGSSGAERNVYGQDP